MDQNILSQIILNTFKQEHYNLLYTIYLKYGSLGNFTFQDLLKEFPFQNINIYQSPSNKKQFTIKKNKKQHKIPNNRCMARCWGSGSYKVSHDPTTNIWSIGDYISYQPDSNLWTYGTQCKRQSNNSQYCSIHLRQLNTDYSSLTHGRVDQEPPHQHYDKYRRKILMAISIHKNKK